MERDSRRLIKMLEDDGWYLVETRGSHRQYKHPQKPGRVTLPHPVKDLNIKTVISICRQAGWK